jgi:hypothetical protein
MKFSLMDASSSRETMGMRRDGRGWCSLIGTCVACDGGQDDLEGAMDEFGGDSAGIEGSDGNIKVWGTIDSLRRVSKCD